jgi:serine/threonine-protein kinase
LPPGTMLDGKYRIDSLLAVGGMGIVYAGTHVAIRKRVAIKVLEPSLSTPAMIARFQREAITASQIGHEGIAQVTDLGTSTSGEAFLVMELLEGESLGARLKTTGPLPIELACELGCAILSPLAAAHHAGIVHRDLKPDNVFLVRQSRGEMVKLLDFGISRASGLEAEFRLTNTGVVMGTPFYMSPEQARGDNEVAPASDLYAFGVILYEMLVGKVPITGENYNQLMYRVMSGEYERPKLCRPDVPDALDEIIVRAMALEPGQRFASATELEHELLAFCRPTYREHMIERMSSAGIKWGASQSNPAPSRPPAAMSGTDPTLVAPSGMHPPVRRSKVPFAIGGLLVVGGIAGVIAATRSPDAAPDPAPAPAAVTAPAPVPAPAPAPAPAAAPAPPPVAPAVPATITLRFAVSPSSATISIDGKPLAGAELVVPKDDVEHVLRIAATGYVAHSDKLRFDESQRLTINLVRKGQKATGKTKTKTERIDTSSPYD